MAEKLREADHRREDFAGGIPIALADSQEWFFAEPRIRLVPSDSDIGFEVFLSLDDDGLYNRIATRYQNMVFLPKDEFAEFADEYAGLEMKVARMMLERNYVLSLEQLQSILQFSHDKDADPVAYGIREAVAKIVIGDSPKPSAGGVAGSPSPRDPSDSTPAC